MRNYYAEDVSAHIEHYGVLGMRWGTRKAVNYNTGDVKRDTRRVNKMVKKTDKEYQKAVKKDMRRSAKVTKAVSKRLAKNSEYKTLSLNARAGRTSGKKAAKEMENLISKETKKYLDKRPRLTKSKTGNLVYDYKLDKTTGMIRGTAGLSAEGIKLMKRDEQLRKKK